jgi:hypothetical protein
MHLRLAERHQSRLVATDRAAQESVSAVGTLLLQMRVWYRFVGIRHPSLS